jgi:hypothetical protein
MPAVSCCCSDHPDGQWPGALASVGVPYVILKLEQTTKTYSDGHYNAVGHSSSRTVTRRG